MKSLTRLAAAVAAGILSFSLLAPVAPAQASPVAAAPSSVVAASSHDAHTKNGAKAAYKRWVRYWNNEDWSAQYNRLVFEQQALVSEEDYIAWRQSEEFSPLVKWLKTLSKTWTRITIPGTDARPKCVKVKARLKVWGTKVNLSAHWVYQERRWRWMLNQEALDELLGVASAG